MTEAAQAEGAPAPETPVEEQTPVAQPEGEQQEPETQQQPEPEPEKKLKGVGKRLHQLTSERDYWKSLATQAQQPAAPEKPQEPVKTLKDFEYDESKYSAYLHEHYAKQAAEVAREEAGKWRESQEKQSRRQSFETRLADFADDHPDLYDGWEATPISQPMAEAIETSDIGPEVAYYLKNNQDVALKLFHLPPVLAAKEIGRIEAQLSAEKAKAKAKPVSKAPPPPPKVEAQEPGLSVSASSPDSDKLSMNDWLKRREKELAKRKS